MKDRHFLLVARLSTDARVEHLPARGYEGSYYVPTLCGRLGRWSSRPSRGGACLRCSALSDAYQAAREHKERKDA